MRPSSVHRYVRRGAVALVFAGMAVPGTALADPQPPAMRQANVVPIVGNLSISTRDSDGHSVADGCVAPGTHRLLCFDFRTHNLGNADFWVGSPAERPDLFVESASHGHFHLKDFNEFALFDLAGNPVVAGAKQAFCLMDSEHLSAWGPDEPRFASCNTNQGISAGWADLYDKDLPCQFVVIDGVPDGTYVLRSTTNAQQIVSESDYGDNTIYTYLQISGAHVSQLEGPPPWAGTPEWDV